MLHAVFDPSARLSVCASRPLTILRYESEALVFLSPLSPLLSSYWYQVGFRATPKIRYYDIIRPFADVSSCSMMSR